MDILASGVVPFTVALGVMLVIIAVEIAGLFIGLQPSAGIDEALPELEIEPDVELGPLSAMLSWLSFGRLPALVVIILLLASFGLIGLIGQNMLQRAAGFMLDPWAAGALGAVGALFVTHHAGHALAKVFPREETDAVSGKEFIGRIATVFRGEARSGAPAEAKLVDSRGKTQYILVEPDDPEAIFISGSDVLLVRQDGPVFRAIIRLPPPRA